jgi:AcrR family transcriptional regulator
MMMRVREGAGPGPTRRGPRGPENLKLHIIETATRTLKEEGFAGTSARAIARTGGFNSALIFYYFGSLTGLLLAALDHSAAQRMARYRAAVEDADTLEDVARLAGQIYREDLEGGHITLFSELIGASLSHPELRPEIVARAQPWLEFVESTLDKVFGRSPIAGLLPTRELAYAFVSLYLGLNLMTHLDTDRSRIEALFSLAERIAPTFSSLLGATDSEN